MTVTDATVDDLLKVVGRLYVEVLLRDTRLAANGRALAAAANENARLRADLAARDNEPLPPAPEATP